MFNWNEYVKFVHYKSALNLDHTSPSAATCGPRYPKLTLCDPTLPNAEDI
jgi:hypothetical protein